MRGIRCRSRACAAAVAHPHKRKEHTCTRVHASPFPNAVGSYLEKALAVHCGGWDKINGGQCTHAWALLTGCKEQYSICKQENGKYRCFGKYNPS